MTAETFQGYRVLPANQTPLEKTLATIAWERLAAIDILIIKRLIDPWTCPFAFLPWLAWSLSVDVWDDTWSEHRKRSVIAASPAIHRIKGSRKAIRLALEALGLRPTIVSWHEDDPPARRATFRVDAEFDLMAGEAFDVRTNTLAYLAVKRSKPKSRVFALRTIARASTTFFSGAYARRASRMTVLPFAAAAPEPIAGPHVGVASARLSRSTILPRAA